MYLEKVKERSVGTFKMIVFYTLMSQALIFLRTKLMAENIVGHYNVEAYLLAILAANYLAEIVSEGLLVSLVPVFHRIREEEGDQARLDFVNNLANIMLLVAIVLIGLSFVFAPSIIGLFDRTLEGEDLRMTIKLFRIALPMLVSVLVRPVYLAFLQSNHGFKAGAKGGMYMNGIYFLYLLIFSRYGVEGLAVAGVLAHASYFLIIPGIVKSQGYEYERRMDLGDVNLARLTSLFLPMVVYILIMRANVKLDVLFAEDIGTVYGALGNANYMVAFIITIIIQVIITISYPLLSECYTRKDEESYKVILNTGLRYISAILIPVMLVLIIFAKPITNLFFGNARVLFFKKAILEGQELETTIRAFRCLSLSVVFIGLNLYFVRVFFSRQDFTTPIVVALVGILVNFLAGKVLIATRGESGLALAKSISNIAMGLLLFSRLKRENLIDMKAFMKDSLDTIFLSTLVVLMIYICYRFVGENDTSLLLGLVLSSYVYFNLYDKLKNVE